jgi:hypothetical protein
MAATNDPIAILRPSEDTGPGPMFTSNLLKHSPL